MEIGRQHRVVLPVRVDRAGVRGPTKHQAAQGGWRRSSRGRYVPSLVETTAVQRVAEAGVLLGRPGVAVTGWGNLAWRGSRWADGRRADGSALPVELASNGQALREQPLLRLCQERVDPATFERVDGLLLTTAVEAACFSARYAETLDAAVEALDMACADDLVSLAEVAAWLAAHPRRRGVDQARAALALADENAWSPREVHLRLAWERAVGVRPLTNRPVFDRAGHHLGTPDLVDPVTGVCGEYDGDHHLTRTQRRKDLARERTLREHDLEPFVVVAGDLSAGGALEQRLATATARAARVPAAERRWTLDEPRWWVPAHTVALRRALSGVEREIWLPPGRRDRRTAG